MPSSGLLSALENGMAGARFLASTFTCSPPVRPLGRPSHVSSEVEMGPTENGMVAGGVFGTPYPIIRQLTTTRHASGHASYEVM